MLRLGIALATTAPIAAIFGAGTFASYSWTGLKILFLALPVLAGLSIVRYRIRATSTSNPSRATVWRGGTASHTRVADGVALMRNKPLASNVRSRSLPAVASKIDMSSRLMDATQQAADPTRTTSGKWPPPLCWRQSNPRNPNR